MTANDAGTGTAQAAATREAHGAGRRAAHQDVSVVRQGSTRADS